MVRAKFQLWHSLVGMALLLLTEALVLRLFTGAVSLQCAVLLMFAVGGAIANLFVSTEVIREVRNTMHMIELLSIVVFEYVIFFAFQYAFFYWFEPNGFQGLTSDAVSLIFHSTMVFVLNPVYLPVTTAAKLLMLIQTYGALAFVLFILQNVWQFRK